MVEKLLRIWGDNCENVGDDFENMGDNCENMGGKLLRLWGDNCENMGDDCRAIWLSGVTSGSPRQIMGEEGKKGSSNVLRDGRKSCFNMTKCVKPRQKWRFAEGSFFLQFFKQLVAA